MSKMLNEDRENVVECRYGQLSSAEQIEKKNRNKTKWDGRAYVVQL